MSSIIRVSGEPEHNELLAALHTTERGRIYPYLQRVAMPLGMVLYEPSDVLRHVYFPIDCIVSLLYVMENGDSAEISVVGNEGLVGVALFMGGESTPSRAIVQSKGCAFRLTARRLKDEFRRQSHMQLLLLRYTQSLLTQMAQTAVCNRLHSVDQQLCRWLLLLWTGKNWNICAASATRWSKERPTGFDPRQPRSADRDIDDLALRPIYAMDAPPQTAAHDAKHKCHESGRSVATVPESLSAGTLRAARRPGGRCGDCFDFDPACRRHS
jgi:hypothetical protein